MAKRGLTVVGANPSDLRELSKEQRDQELRRRLLAIADVADGKPRQQVVQAYGFSRQRLWTFVRVFNEGGIAALLQKSTRGRPSKISAVHLRAVAEFMLSDYDRDRKRSNRTLTDAIRHLDETCKVPVGPSSMRLFLNFYLEIDRTRMHRGGTASPGRHGTLPCKSSLRRAHVQRLPIYRECQQMMRELRAQVLGEGS